MNLILIIPILRYQTFTSLYFVFISSHSPSSCPDYSGSGPSPFLVIMNSVCPLYNFLNYFLTQRATERKTLRATERKNLCVTLCVLCVSLCISVLLIRNISWHREPLKEKHWEPLRTPLLISIYSSRLTNTESATPCPVFSGKTPEHQVSPTYRISSDKVNKVVREGIHLWY